jgi:hypothetical protein
LDSKELERNYLAKTENKKQKKPPVKTGGYAIYAHFV